jgi:aryl-alcohol dehydrogenase-like predicted oxidoreductase
LGDLHNEDDMETIEIGSSGLVSSRIALGTWAIGGWMWGGTDAREALRAIDAAVDHGITLIDTAPVYGFGHSEEIVGRALRAGHRRDRVLIATKCGLSWQGEKVFRNAAGRRIEQEVDDSLRRLRTDRIDLYQVHWPDPLVPVEETAGSLARLFTQGKIRAVGASNFNLAQMEKFRKAAPLHATQPPYNLFERAIDTDVLPYAKKTGLAVLAYGALCRGLLSGKITAETRFDGDDLRRHDPKFQAARFPQYLAAVAELERFARAFWQNAPLPRGALDPRPRADDRPLGCAARGSPECHRRRLRLVPRQRREARDRCHSRANHPRSGRT